MKDRLRSSYPPLLPISYWQIQGEGRVSDFKWTLTHWPYHAPMNSSNPVVTQMALSQMGHKTNLKPMNPGKGMVEKGGSGDDWDGKEYDRL